jgi:DNA replication initiation complex subunit (GINS family)
MLTFETLSKIAREEKASPSLTRLPEDFFESVSTYIYKKMQLNEGSDNWELENAKMVLSDIMKIRERKIVLSAFSFADSGVEPPNLTPDEKHLFDQAASMIMQFRTGRKNVLEPEHEKKSIIAFLEDVPQFVGSDMSNYGPFGKGDIANLPEDVTRLLIEKGAARPLEAKEHI